MTIKRGGISEPISGQVRARELPVYCPTCAANGIRTQDTMLKPRLDYFAFDAKQWRQCYHCGKIIGTPDIPQPGELHTDIQTIDNKFYTKRETEQDIPKERHARGFNARLDGKKQQEIKDPDVKKELKKGAKLLNYSEL